MMMMMMMRVVLMAKKKNRNQPNLSPLIDTLLVGRADHLCDHSNTTPLLPSLPTNQLTTLYRILIFTTNPHTRTYIHTHITPHPQLLHPPRTHIHISSITFTTYSFHTLHLSFSTTPPPPRFTMCSFSPRFIYSPRISPTDHNKQQPSISATNPRNTNYSTIHRWYNHDNQEYWQ